MSPLIGGQLHGAEGYFTGGERLLQEIIQPADAEVDLNGGSRDQPGQQRRKRRTSEGTEQQEEMDVGEASKLAVSGSGSGQLAHHVH